MRPLPRPSRRQKRRVGKRGPPAICRDSSPETDPPSIGASTESPDRVTDPETFAERRTRHRDNAFPEHRLITFANERLLSISIRVSRASRLLRPNSTVGWSIWPDFPASLRFSLGPRRVVASNYTFACADDPVSRIIRGDLTRLSIGALDTERSRARTAEQGRENSAVAFGAVALDSSRRWSTAERRAGPRRPR